MNAARRFFASGAVFSFACACAAAQEPARGAISAVPATVTISTRALDYAPAYQPPPVARAVELAFSATTWAQVRVSTSGAAHDLGRLVEKGYYKRELITLVVLSAAAKKPLGLAAEKRRKGAKLSAIALDYNLDYAKMLERAVYVEEQVDRVYLPLFPEKGPRREREE